MELILLKIDSDMQIKQNHNNEFTEATKVHSNDDGVCRDRLAPFNAYYLT